MATEAERNRGLGAYSTPGVDVTAPSDKQYVPIGSAPAVQFRTTLIDPPSFVYVGREDKLFFFFWSAQAGVTANVFVRIMRPDGVIIINAYSFTAAIAEAAFSFTQELTEGFLLGITVLPTSQGNGTKHYGELQLIRGVTTTNVISQHLGRGFFTLEMPLCFPPISAKDELDGQGNALSITGTTPVAGVDISELMTAGTRRRLRTITASLTTGAGVANREVVLQIADNAGKVLAQVPSTFTQVASLTHRYTFALGLQTQAGAQALIHTAPAPDTPLAGQWTVKTVTANIQAADQWTAPQYEVEEWPEF